MDLCTSPPGISEDEVRAKANQIIKAFHRVIGEGFYEYIIGDINPAIN